MNREALWRGGYGGGGSSDSSSDDDRRGYVGRHGGYDGRSGSRGYFIRGDREHNDEELCRRRAELCRERRDEEQRRWEEEKEELRRVEQRAEQRRELQEQRRQQRAREDQEQRRAEQRREEQRDGMIMYHGTSESSARAIESGGFRVSENGMLGKGVYCSRDFDKAKGYAQENERGVVLTVSVRPGKVKRIDAQGHDMQKNWHAHGYDTAWVPPNTMSMSPSGMQENCVRDPGRLTVLSAQSGYGTQ